MKNSCFKYTFLACCFFVFSVACEAQVYPGTNNSFPADSPDPPNDSPVWNNTPAPVFAEGVASSYDLAMDCSDPDDDPLTFVNEAGCTLPTGMAIDNINDELDEDGTSPVATTTSCVFSCDDGTNPPVDSSAFSIVVSSLPALGTIYERDMFGTPRTGTTGGNETGTGSNPVVGLDYGIPIVITDFPCDATVTLGDSTWAKVNNSGNQVVCLSSDNHNTVKGLMNITDGGSAGSEISISAITFNDPVRVDFSSSHGWSTNDYIWCDDAVGGTWQLHWRNFRVTVIDPDTVDLQGEDATGTALQPAWTTYTSGGTCKQIIPKVIRHVDNLVTHPFLLATGDQARIGEFNCDQSGVTADDDYVWIWGLTVPDHSNQTALFSTSGAGGCDNWAIAYSSFNASSNVPSTFMNITQGSDYFVVQDNVATMDVTSGSQEADFVTPGQGVNGTRVVNNEAWNMTSHSVQFQAGGDLEGTVIAGNSFYVNSDAYTDSDGTPNPSGTHACAEKSIELKQANSGARETSKSKIIRIEGNMIFGFRPTVASCSGGSGNSGAAAGTGDGQEMADVLFLNNLSWDMADFIQHTGSAGIDVDNWSYIGNIAEDITHTSGVSDAFKQWDPANTNDLNEWAFNTIKTVDTWLEATSGQTGDFTCNLLINANGLSGSFGGTRDQNYGYGNTTNLTGSDVDGGAVSNALMNDLTVQPFIISAPATDVIIADILSISSSPHFADCTSVGSASNGVSDETVTF